MGEIYRNSSQYEYLDIVNGTADAQPTVALKRTGLSDVPLTPSHITSDLPSGVQDRWRVYVPLQYTVNEGTFTLEWTATVGGEPIVKTDYFTVVTPYILPQEVARREGWVIDVDQTQSDLVIAERIARNIIDSLCGGGFGSVSKTLTVYGAQTDQLFLGYPIQSIDTVYRDGVLVIGPGYNALGFDLEITESGQSLRIINTGENIGESEEMDPVVTLGFFDSGSRYEVTGLFGSQSVPEKIKDAAWLLVKDFLCQDATWRTKYVSRVQTQNWRMDFSSMTWWGTGNSIVDRLIDEWREPPMMVI